MTICGWCHGTGEFYGKLCSCQTKRKGYFPGIKKKNDDLLPQAHKHRHSEFIDRVGHKEWFMCSCGDIKKIYVD